MADFTYMGTKRLLSGRIAEASFDARRGPFLDLFSGLSAVGTAIGTSRPVWCNDVQVFSFNFTKAMFTSSNYMKTLVSRNSDFDGLFRENLKAIEIALGGLMKKEKLAHATATLDALLIVDASSSVESPVLRDEMLQKGTYCLLATTHAGTYFSLRQCAEMDSIRYALDSLLAHGAIAEEEHRWGLIALCKAAQNVSNSTGHFAQPLAPKPNNIQRILAKRRRSALAAWTTAVEELHPLGTQAWRAKNRCFNSDSIELLHQLEGDDLRPSVIYADPPYTSDQYSRYYHVLETLFHYDYPTVSGRGQYRPDRFVSRFSLAREVDAAFRELIELSRKLNCRMMISYPESGLLKDSTAKIEGWMSERFRRVSPPLKIAHEHSTMGASKGKQKHAVNEVLFVADP